MAIGLLICTLISKKQGLEKSRSVSNLRKRSDHANLSPGFFSGLWYKPSFFLGGDLEKKSRFAGPEFFLRFGRIEDTKETVRN